MGKGCCTFMRVVLGILSVLFMIIGLLVIGVAVFAKIAIQQKLNGQHPDTVQAFSITIYSLIGVGAFMSIFGFIGCFAACRKSPVCLGIYIFILLIVIIAEIAVTIITFIFALKVRTMASNYFKNGVKQYKDKGTMDPLLDFVQKTVQCCGDKGPSDYGLKLPKSCCDGVLACTTTVITNSRPGCTSAVLDQNMKTKPFKIGIAVILGIVLIELIGLALAIAICCDTRRQDAGYVSVVN